MGRDVLIAVAGGLASALAALAVSTGSGLALIFIYLAAMPIFLIGLSRGAKLASMASSTGFLATAITGGLISAGVYGVVYALPAWVITHIVLIRRPSENDNEAPPRFYSVGHALSVLSLVGAGLMVSAHLGAGEDGLRKTLSVHMGDMFQAFFTSVDASQRGQMIDMILPLFPGAVAVSWVSMALINAVLAQGILARSGQNLRPSPAYAGLTVPQWASWPLVLSAGAALTGPVLGMEDLGYLGRNAAMVTAVPYFLLGLAVIHTLARRVNGTPLILATVYVVALLSGWAAIVVAGVGVIEQWIGLRGRSGTSEAGGGSGEEE